ncbi:hypothetical protein [Cupriavidus sp. YR651]|uniref:hypothetical protein n=1 Tax=Cupriavidus sp. YR651 TaxID=1855315 RepID=UPI000B87EE1E|nr:hypothetical protein [Cupriavidus sp. YR651]
MKKIFTWIASILILVAFAWNWIGVTDEIKLARFERLCREQATEDVRENSADGTAILSGTGLEERLDGWKIAGTFRRTWNQLVRRNCRRWI